MTKSVRRALSVGVFLVGALAACTSHTAGQATGGSSKPSTQAPISVGALQDPLVSVTDSDSTDFVAKNVTPLIHEKGSGPGEFRLIKPVGPTAVRFYVACSPASEFTVRMGNFYSGGCALRFQNTGQFPVDSNNGIFTVQLEIPDGVEYWIMALPIQKEK